MMREVWNTKVIRISAAMRTMLTVLISCLILQSCAGPGVAVRGNRNYALKPGPLTETGVIHSHGVSVHYRPGYDSITTGWLPALAVSGPYLLHSRTEGLLGNSFSYVTETGENITDSFFQDDRSRKEYHHQKFECPVPLWSRPVEIRWNHSKNERTHYQPDGRTREFSTWYPEGGRKRRLIPALPEGPSGAIDVGWYQNGSIQYADSGARRYTFSPQGVLKTFETDTLIQRRLLRHLWNYHDNGVLAEDVFLLGKIPCLRRQRYSQDGRLIASMRLPAPGSLPEPVVEVEAPAPPAIFKFVTQQADLPDRNIRFAALLDSLKKLAPAPLRGEYVIRFRVNESGEQELESLSGTNAAALQPVLTPLFNTKSPTGVNWKMAWRPAKHSGRPVTALMELKFSAQPIIKYRQRPAAAGNARN